MSSLTNNSNDPSNFIKPPTTSRNHFASPFNTIVGTVIDYPVSDDEINGDNIYSSTTTTPVKDHYVDKFEFRQDVSKDGEQLGKTKGSSPSSTSSSLRTAKAYNSDKGNTNDRSSGHSSSLRKENENDSRTEDNSKGQDLKGKGYSFR